jgi:hypothetical protein
MKRSVTEWVVIWLVMGAGVALIGALIGAGAITVAAAGLTGLVLACAGPLLLFYPFGTLEVVTHASERALRNAALVGAGVAGVCVIVAPVLTICIIAIACLFLLFAYGVTHLPSLIMASSHLGRRSSPQHDVDDRNSRRDEILADMKGRIHGDGASAKDDGPGADG